MSTEPEALRLADKLDRDGYSCFTQDMRAAAAELRRLHAENDEVKAKNEVQCLMIIDLRQQIEADHKAMQQAVEALAGAIEWDCARDFPVPYRVRDPLSAALASLRERAGG